MMLWHLGIMDGANAIEQAVNSVLQEGQRTGDLFSDAEDRSTAVGTIEMGALVTEKLGV